MKKLYIRFVLWLIEPALRQELNRLNTELRREFKFSHTAFDHNVRMAFERLGVAGWRTYYGADLELRKAFWRKIEKQIEASRASPISSSDSRTEIVLHIKIEKTDEQAREIVVTFENVPKGMRVRTTTIETNS